MACGLMGFVALRLCEFFGETCVDLVVFYD